MPHDYITRAVTGAGACGAITIAVGFLILLVFEYLLKGNQHEN